MIDRLCAALSLTHDGDSTIGHCLLDIIVTVDLETCDREKESILFHQAGVVLDILDNDFAVTGKFRPGKTLYEFYKRDNIILIRAGTAGGTPSRLSLFRRV